MTIKPSSLFEAIRVPECPFPGLRPFEFHESDLFFGRDGQVERLITKLAEPRFLSVVGTSGSGKSSLVRAGLLPALVGGMMSGAKGKWRIAVMRPGNDPIGNLARALNHPDVFGSDDPENAAIQVHVAEATLRLGSRGLVEAVRQNAMPERENLLVVADQFEELFRFAREASRKSKEDSDRYRNEAAAFVKLLLEARRQREVNIFVVLTMRSDFLGDCAQFWDLPEAVNEGQYLIPRLTRDQLREVITGPVSLGGREIAPRLVTQLLNDIGDDQDQLPVLQHLLMRVWNEWKEKRLEIQVEDGGGKVRRPHKELHKGARIDLCCYQAVGGMAEALSLHADEAFNELPDDRHCEVTERFFKALTEKGPDNREIRRPITLGEISTVVDASEAELIRIIDIFRQPGRSFLMPPAEVALKSESLVDISHESLIRGWQRLKKWTEDEAQSARIYRRLAETAILNSQGDEALLIDPALQVALDWRVKNNPNPDWARRYHPAFEAANAFLDASLVNSREQEEVEKKRFERELKQARDIAEQQEKLAAVQSDAAKRRKRYLVGLALLTAVTIVGSFLALRRLSTLKENAVVQARIARDARDEAQAARDEAQGKAVELEKTLGLVTKAEQKALDAKTAAEGERDKARRLKVEKQDQATTYGYFKGAFDDLAARDHEGAALSLQKALEYFTNRRDTPNILSTLINIGDVYREAYRISKNADTLDEEEHRDDLKSLQRYDSAIEGLKTRHGDEARLASTLEKAGSVWAESSDLDEKMKAAHYYERAGVVYHDLGRTDDEAARFIDVGKIFIRSDIRSDDASFQMARQAFDKAIKVYSDAGDKRKIAETNLAIGDECEKLLQRVTRDDSYLIVETPGEAPPDEPQMAEVRRQRLNRKVQLEDDLRRIAAHYFKAASDEQDRSGKPDEAAEMLLRAGAVLSGSKLATLKGQAADVFTRASQRYEKANNMEQQTSALTSAGDVFREAENKELWPRADEYYEQAAKTYHDAGLKDKEAGTLTSIGQSYGSSDDPGQKRKGISYYERAARIYGEIQNKSAAGNALINAASLWEDIVGEEAQVQAAAFYDRAVAVYENDVPKQVSTLIRIGRSLARSTNERRILKSQAYFQKAVVLAEQTGDRKAGASAYLDVGVAYQGLRNYALAIPNFERARSIYQEVNDSFGQGMALYRLATVHNLTPATKAKAPELADQSLAQLALALPGVWSSGDKKGLADTHYAIGSLYRLKKDYARALESYTTAYDLYRTLTGQAQRVSATLYTIKQLKKQLGKAP